MLKFDLHKASRVLFELLGDFSRWWLRRSRERFQNPKNQKELEMALTNFENFFYQYLKILAPLAPFTTEYLYQEIKNDIRKRYVIQESIHLENLPKPIQLTLKEKILLEEMQKAREIASEVHRLRKEKGIKIRQPLNLLSLKTKLSPEVLEVLKDEVNVLEIKTDPKQFDEILLDFEITPELKEIGIYNDFVRFIQDLRQDANLTPQEIVNIKIEIPKILEDVLKKRMKQLLSRTKTEIGKKPKIIIAEKEFNYDNFGKVKISLFK
jgi:isoleucyl-tRNA synthetase